MLSRFFTDEIRNKIVNTLFYLALTIELVLMIVEKSEIHIGFESHVFRLTFLLTFIAALLIKRDRKEWIVLAALLAFTAVCYVLSGKNDLLRIAVFMMAARDIDLKKAMKYSFYLCLCGFSAIALLSVFGILGDVVVVADYGRGVAHESRLVLGFGHPNTLIGCVFSLVLMWLWIYGEKARMIYHLVVIVISFIFAVFTRSRTAMAVLAMVLILGLLLRLFPKLGEKKVIYVLTGLVTPFACTGLAVLAAGISQNMYIGGGIPHPENIWRIEGILNYRISSIYYEALDRGAILCKWKLFAGRSAGGYFDMGWVRLFYWYGIIPTVLIALAILLVIYVCCKKRDPWTLLIILSVSVYTIIEATFVSRYIGRAFYLMIAGVYLGYLFKGKTNE